MACPPSLSVCALEKIVVLNHVNELFTNASCLPKVVYQHKPVGQCKLFSLCKLFTATSCLPMQAV